MNSTRSNITQMNTPETDAVSEMLDFKVDLDFARKLERERDEARAAFVIATDQMVIAHCKLREANKDRDEAIKQNKKLRDIAERAISELGGISRWRSACHEYDADIGSPMRYFSDDEEWDLMEREAAHEFRRLQFELDQLKEGAK